MFSNPFKLFPAEAATLQYEVYFSDDFDFVIAGKLPGVTLGEHRGQHASGTCFSLRFFCVFFSSFTCTSFLANQYRRANVKL